MSLVKSRGVILGAVKYTDHSSIVTLFLEEMGVMPFLYRANTKHQRSNINGMLLSVVDVEFAYRENKSLQYFKDIEISESFSSIRENMYKSTIVMFIAEVLKYVLRGEYGHKEIFDYIVESLKLLDESKQDFSNFHLIFLTQLSEYLGYGVMHFSQEATVGGPMNHLERNRMTEEILDYYKCHIPDFPEIKSYEILKEIFS